MVADLSSHHADAGLVAAHPGFQLFSSHRHSLVMGCVIDDLLPIRHMISGLKYVNAGAVAGLCFVVYQTQKTIWRVDMREKEREKTRTIAVAKTYAAQRELYVFTCIPEPVTAVNPNSLPVS